MFGFFNKKQPLNRNQLLRNQLMKNGDDGSVERHTIHYAYPHKEQSPSKYSDVETHMKAHGFKTREAASDGGIVFEHQSSVTAIPFDTLTEKLEKYLTTNGWEYDGWECAVVENKG